MAMEESTTKSINKHGTKNSWERCMTLLQRLRTDFRIPCLQLRFVGKLSIFV